MEVVPDDKAKGLQTPIWEEYKKIVNDAEKKEVPMTVCMPASAYSEQFILFMIS